MKTILLITAITSLTFSRLAFAGGGCATFDPYAFQVLNQSEPVKEMLQTTFTITNNGFMGPLDGPAPVTGSRRYTYMEFEAVSKKSSDQKFMIRIHFDAMKTLKFKSVEIIPNES